MSIVQHNIKYLRKQKGWTQEVFAQQLGIKRSLVGAYEEGRADPRLQTLAKMGQLFEVSVDDLVATDLRHSQKREKGQEKLRILSITVDSEDRENIEWVPQKASAGYLNGYADPEYIKELPRFQLPNLPSNATHRAFEISGDSMLPIQPGSIIIGKYVESPQFLKSGKTYVLVTEKEGVVYKRVYDERAEGKGLQLVSDNPAYEPYFIAPEEVLEMWEAEAYLSTRFPEPLPEENTSLTDLAALIRELQEEVRFLKKRQ